MNSTSVGRFAGLLSPAAPPFPVFAPAAPSRRFRALGTQVTVWADRDLEPWFREVERTLSRFDPDSALSRLNRGAGALQVVPSMLYDAIAAALQAAEATGGAFDPTVLPAVEAAGYSRSFELGPARPAPPVPAGRWLEVRLVPALRAVLLPRGVGLDLGGIGKGLAVDGALQLLPDHPRALVDAGGDIAFRTAAGDPPVEVEVENPFDQEETLALLTLRCGAVATSSTLGRAWGNGLHHIIDPRTGRPTETDLIAATVVARTAAHADVLAKSCIVLGHADALPLLQRWHAAALLVTRSGDLIRTPGLEEFLHVDTQRN